QIHDIAEVAAPVPVELKGIAEPLLLYELRGIGGRFAQRLPEMDTALDRQVDVALPVACWVIYGKVASKEAIARAVLPVGMLQVRNVRLRLTYSMLGQDSGDLYGKVLAAEQQDGVCVTHIRLTSVDAMDQKVIDGLVGV